MENTIKKTQVCLTLTGATLQEDAALVRKYTQYIDIAELRVDYLNEDEQLSARRFPAMIPIPNNKVTNTNTFFMFNSFKYSLFTF